MGSTVPKRIGFLATQFDEYYQNLVFHGALEEARRYPVQLIFYEGSNSDTLNKAGALDDTAFSLAAKTQLDGLIVMTNTMGFLLPERSRYLASFKHTHVSIGCFSSLISALMPAAVWSITSHLVEVHSVGTFLF